MKPPKRIIGRENFRAEIRAIKGKRTWADLALEVGVEAGVLRYYMVKGKPLGPEFAARFGYRMIEQEPIFVKREGEKWN